MGEGDRVRDVVVDLDMDLSVSEEGAEPRTQGRSKAKESEEVKEALNVDVVEEPLDVKEEEGANHLSMHTALGCVDNCQGSIKGAVVLARAKLLGGKDGVEARIK